VRRCDPHRPPETDAEGNTRTLSPTGKATSKPANEAITDPEVITDPNSQRDEVGTQTCRNWHLN